MNDLWFLGSHTSRLHHHEILNATPAVSKNAFKFLFCSFTERPLHSFSFKNAFMSSVEQLSKFMIGNQERCCKQPWTIQNDEEGSGVKFWVLVALRTPRSHFFCPFPHQTCRVGSPIRAWSTNVMYVFLVLLCGGWETEEVWGQGWGWRCSKLHFFGNCILPCILQIKLPQILVSIEHFIHGRNVVLWGFSGRWVSDVWMIAAPKTTRVGTENIDKHHNWISCFAKSQIGWIYTMTVGGKVLTFSRWKGTRQSAATTWHTKKNLRDMVLCFNILSLVHGFAFSAYGKPIPNMTRLASCYAG